MSLLQGLISATYTPFDHNGSLKLSVVPDYVEDLIASQMQGLYVCGSTGEGVNLSVEERKQVAEAFVQAVNGRIPVVVQVGANCLADCQALAQHAESIGATAISASAPSYFKITSTELMVDYMGQISRAAPKIPFYYYHIPLFTGANIDLIRFLSLAESQIPGLAGIKYTDLKVFEYQDALNFKQGRYELLWGCDEMLLSALAVGAIGGVGSTYALIPSVYRNILDAWRKADWDRARAEQLKSWTYVKTLNQFGSFHAAQKVVLKEKGFDFGTCRLPIAPLPSGSEEKIRAALKSIGFDKTW